MTESSTPTLEAASIKTAARLKDRNCPFCNQSFTSSSLGRHLDLYIREKNPKAADGVHDVDEIRRMRQGITRRMMRNGRREGSLSTQTAPIDGNESDRGSPEQEHSLLVNQKTGEKVRIMLNEPSWHITGVINNLPPRQTGESKSGSNHARLKSDLDQRHKVLEELENGRAAELALKEVLGRIREATTRTIGRDLFDFDPYTMNFPSLCLRILTPPPTLFSPTPFPSSESWSISPPGQRQFEALNKAIADRLAISQMQNTQRNKSISTQSSSSSLSPTKLTHDLNTKLFAHVSDAYSHWKCLPEKTRQETWQLEILRSYSRAEEARLKAEADLAATKEALERLKANAERVGQWIAAGDIDQKYNPPHISPLQSSTFPHYPPDVVKDIWSTKDFDVQSWDYDRLLTKWKGKVKEERQQSNGLAAQRSLSVSSLHPPAQRKASQVSNASISSGNNVSASLNSAPYPQSVPTPTIPQPPTRSETNNSDSADVMDEDASGDSDDAEGDVDVDMAISPAAPFPPPQNQQNQTAQQQQQMPQTQQAHLSPNPSLQHQQQMPQQPTRTPSPSLTKNQRIKQQHIPSPLARSQQAQQQQFNAETAQMAVPHPNWQAHAQHLTLQRGFEAVPDAYMGMNLTHAHAMAGLNGSPRLGDGTGQ